MMKNSSGKIYYGMHFYPGVAEYAEDGRDPFRVFLSEETLRQMDPSFAGKPVFVMHVDEVEPNLDKLRTEADGWVIESFFNQADGKHWVKFIVTSDEGLRAIEQGMRLSNAYIPTSLGNGGRYSGVEFQKEINSAEFEHLAIVPNPRYEDSIILTPEEYKDYCQQNLQELKKLSNNKEKTTMLSFFKKSKVENAPDLETLSVVLPKCKKEIELSKLINDADEAEVKKKEPQMAHLEHMVDADGEKMSVKDMMAKYKDMKDSLEERKKDENDSEDLEKKEEREEDRHNDEKEIEKEEEKEDRHNDDFKKSEREVAESRKKNSGSREDQLEKELATLRAERLRNAHNNAFAHDEIRTVDTPYDKLQRGKFRYGAAPTKTAY